MATNGDNVLGAEEDKEEEEEEEEEEVAEDEDEDAFVDRLLDLVDGEETSLAELIFSLKGRRDSRSYFDVVGG